MLDVWLAALLDSSLKGLALCLAAGAAALLLRRSSAAARHLVWRLAFAGLLALPVLATLLPAWRVPLPGGAARIAAAVPSPILAGPSAPAVAAADSTPSREGTSPSPTFEQAAAEPRGWNLSWQAVGFGIWLLGAFAVLGSLGLALLRVGWQGRRARPIEDPAWTGLLRQVRAELGVGRPVALVAGGDRAMPMTWGWRRPVVLLPAGAEMWPEPRRRAVLLHELAHVARRDYPAQLGSEVVRALYWFNPLVWMAARKLRIESEHACDDRVLTAGARASDYAGDLLDIARSFRAGRATVPAGLAMARPSQLAGRLLAVLDVHRDRRGVSRRFAFPAWLAAACVVFPLAALAPPTPPHPPATSVHSHSTSHEDINGTQTFQWSEDGHRIKIRTEGKVDLNEDWTGIARLARGAEMRIEEKGAGAERRLDVEPGSDGRPVYTWKVDGTERPFDAAGRQWLRDMLLRFVRGTGYAADERIAVILRKQGPEGVLAEISQIPSEYVKGIYFKKLLAHRDLGSAVVEKAIRQAGREIKSDYELSQTLRAAAQSQPLTESMSTAYAEAARSIQSDYEQRQALTALASRGRLTPATLAMLLQSARGIKSDYERASLLVEIAGQYKLSGAPRDAYLEAARSIHSQYERQRAEAALVERSGR